MLKCTINGKSLEVKEGTTIIEAMSQNGMKIAHYCWHPGLSVAGVCRLCMVEIAGNPRLQIACNTVVTEGMVINNSSEKVRDAVKWGLDFHLINHPLDCPICDQAGECGLQEQFMEYGKYDPEMAEKKVKKRKVVDLGPRVVLDSERCILCARCVRFTHEVSRSHELGIFNRGDLSEVGTFDGKILNNKYSTNVVDICPVGALTSKDFRFRQRVWYLKEGTSICNGCSTGCNIRVSFNKEGLFRVKPSFNPQVNGYWMCDEGRDIYKFVNRESRLIKAKKHNQGENGWRDLFPGAAAKESSTCLKQEGSSLALVLTGQNTNEEYEAIVSLFVDKLKSKNIFHWVNNKESFEHYDGLLLRGDKNPNTKGLLNVLSKHEVTATWNQYQEGLKKGQFKTVVVIGPENHFVYPDLKDRVQELNKVENVIWMQSGNPAALGDFTELKGNTWLIPLKTFIEKEGTFVNYAGSEQKFKKVTTVVSEALSLLDVSSLLSGEALTIKPDPLGTLADAARPLDQVVVETRIKNEFIFRRGSI